MVKFREEMGAECIFYVSCRLVLNFEMVYCSVSSVIAAESKVYLNIIFGILRSYLEIELISFCTTTHSLVLEVVCDCVLICWVCLNSGTVL